MFDEYNDVSFFDNDIIKFLSIQKVSYKECSELLYKAKNGDELAKSKFIESNLIVVKNVIERVLNLNVFVDKQALYEDLFQDGVIALLKEYERFDSLDAGAFRFYAWKAVSEQVSKSIKKNINILSLSYVDLKKCENIYKELGELISITQQIPSINEISKEAGFSNTEINIALKYLEPVLYFDTTFENLGEKITNNNENDSIKIFEENLELKQIILNSLLKKYKNICSREELEAIFEFCRLYNKSFNMKIGLTREEFDIAISAKSKLLSIRDNPSSSELLFQKYRSVYSNLKKADVIIKRYFLTEYLTQEEIAKFYGLTRKRISAIEAATLKQIKGYLLKHGEEYGIYFNDFDTQEKKLTKGHNDIK